MDIDDAIHLKQQYWDEKWGDPEFSPIWANRDIPEFLLSFISSHPPENFKTVVDIGCGLGELALWFDSIGYEASAFDISEFAIRKAKTEAPQNKVNFFVHDITTAPLKNKFTILVDRGCLHGISPILRPVYARNIGESSHPGAVFILFVRAFRGHSSLTRDEEKKAHFKNYTSILNPYFKLEHFSECDLSPKSGERVMPGLLFVFRKI